MKKLSKNIFVFVVLFISFLMFASFLYSSKESATEVALSELAGKVKSEEVSKITVEGGYITASLKDGKIISTQKESESGIIETLKNYGVDAEKIGKVELDIKNESGMKFWASVILPSLIPILIIGLFLWFTFRQAKSGANQAFNFGKSNIKLFTPFKDKVSFADVAGLKESKQELMEVVDFLKNPKKYLDLGARIPRGVLLLGQPGTGKCVVGETWVPTNKGLLQIKDIPKYFWINQETNEISGASVPSLQIENAVSQDCQASHWYELGEQDTLKVHLRQGASLEGTPEHPVAIMNESGQIEFREISKLKVGDLVAIKYNTQCFGSLKEINTEKAYLMGLLTGDGNLSHSSRVGFTTTDNELALAFSSYIKENYPETNVYMASDKITHAVSSWKIKKDLYESGMSHLLSYDKIIPPFIMMSPKEVIIAFLQGLFDTDGYFERYTVGYATVSKTLSDQVLAMLLNLGIVAKRRIKSSASESRPRPVYEIMISGTSLQVFALQIGFRLRRKQMKLEEYLSTHAIGNTNIDIFYNLEEKIKKCWEEIKKANNGRKNLEHTAKIIDKVKSRKRISRRSLQMFVMAYKESGAFSPNGEYLKNILSSNLFFSPVTSLERGRATVYDFTISETHSFVSNGIVSHNTLLARAVAGEAQVPFFHISASEFVEMFVGVGASRTRDAFATAKKASPSILFIDEIDAIGRERGAGVGGGHDEREQTLNQILVEMDGFDKENQVIVLAATNRPDILDPALLRPGRFDRTVVLDLPDINDREAILKIHSRNKILDKKIDLKQIAVRTPGFSGADLANLMNEGAILAARNGRQKIDQPDLYEAIEKVLLGPERRSRVSTKKEKEITAYHEAGHALVSASLKDADPVHKVSIVARGQAGGYTLKLPIEENRLRTKKQFLSEMATMFGGYVAEEFIYKDLSTGASNDLTVASDLARKLVTKYGMSEKFGPITFGKTQELVFLGKEIAHEKNYSETTALEIDREVERFIQLAYKAAKNIISKRKNVLDVIAQTLLKEETIEKDRFDEIIKKYGLKPTSI